jgi:ribosomal protein S18 acetylase RimI-like enzyme
VNVFADQMERRQELERTGFTSQAEAGEDAWSEVWMERKGVTEAPSFLLPKGFTMRSLAGESEVDAYVESHQAVFKTKNMTTGWRIHARKHPGYKPDLDVVVAAPDGRLVAFCIDWLAQSSDGMILGQIEPLGCHADFRKYALGRMVLCETLRRLQQQGAKRIFVKKDNYRNAAFRLYESVEFQMIRVVQVYRKGYNDTSV